MIMTLNDKTTESVPMLQDKSKECGQNNDIDNVDKIESNNSKRENNDDNNTCLYVVGVVSAVITTIAQVGGIACI